MSKCMLVKKTRIMWSDLSNAGVVDICIICNLDFTVEHRMHDRMHWKVQLKKQRQAVLLMRLQDR